MSNQVLIYSTLLRWTWIKHFFHSSRRINNNSYGTKSLGPIVCSAQCNPPCQYHWIKPDQSVVDGSNIEIPNLSKNDHGTFTCHAGNGHGNNGTKNLNVTVNCKYLVLNTMLLLARNAMKRID